MATTRKPRTAKPVNDGLVNFVSRVGTGSDKAFHNTYAMDYHAAQPEIDAAYRTSWFRKIVDIVPFDEVREWRTWAGADDTQTTMIDTEEKRLGLRHKIKDARTLARKDGGAAILIATRGTGNLMRPLDPETVGKDGLQYLAVMPRDRIHPREEIRDPESPWYGEPSYYEIAKQDRTQVKIHPSRVIRFVGNPIMSANEWTGWGDSVWIEMRDAVRNVDSVAANTAAMLAEAKIDVIKLKSLMTNLSTAEGESLLVRRFAAVNSLKSIVNALVLDADDEHDTKTLNFAGLKDINDIMLLMMSGMADIPQTRLFGRSPQGMNATGESDLRNYYDRIRAGQTVELSPLLAPLDEMLIRSALGSRPPEIYYEWAPLYTLSEKEQADIENTFADAAIKLANTGLLADDALSQIVQNRITEAGNWPGAEKAFNEAKLDPDFAREPTPEEVAADEARQAEIAQDARPRTLYVRRDVLNAKDIIAWAKEQGIETTLPADDMHVTVTFSRQPVDWMKMGENWSSDRDGSLVIEAGGPRLVDKFGDATVMLFASSTLSWRHEDMRRNGASWDHPEYQPHITITYKHGGGVSDMEPYRGRIVLGPEIFEEVNEDWSDEISEA